MINFAFKELDREGFSISALEELLRIALSKVNKQEESKIHSNEDKREFIENTLKESVDRIIDNLQKFKVLKEYAKITTFKEKLKSNQINNSQNDDESENEYSNDNLQENEFQEITNVDTSLETNEKVFRFDFVGIIEIEGISLCVFPKYIENLEDFLSKDKHSSKESELENKDPDFEDCDLIINKIALYQDDNKLSNEKNNFINKIKKVVAVIYKYKNENPSFTSQEEDEVFSIVTTTIQLIHSFFEHGLYFNEKDIIQLEGEGEIFWDKTINECTPYIFDKDPYYLDFYRFNKEIPEESFFKQLHAAILTEASGAIQILLKIIDLEVLSLTSQSIDSFGNLDYLISRINKELSNQFITYKQEILILMKNYLSFKKQSQGLENQLYFYGTGKFYTIWEKACSEYYTNCIEQKIGDIFINSKEYEENEYFKEHKDKTLKDIIPKPEWKISLKKDNDTPDNNSTLNVENSDKQKPTLIPDIISIDTKKKNMQIFDAKYYIPIVSLDNIQQQPGIGDIDKQFLYLLAYLQFSKEMHLKITENCFIMPKPIYAKDAKKDEYEVEVSFDLFDENFFISMLGLKEKKDAEEYYFENPANSPVKYNKKELETLTKIKVKFENPEEVFNKCLSN